MGKKWRYGVIIDAGSSGSRLHVYRWKDAATVQKDADADDLNRLPKIKAKGTKKIRPGVSTFGEKPTAVGAEHLQELLDYALEVVPADKIADTPIYLMATAGMRLLPQVQQTALLREICSYLRQATSFALPDCADSIQVIPGETEGLYGWLAANYLLGGFDRPEEHDHSQKHHTYGFLDMGGASAQIAFEPNATEAAEHADALKLVRLRTLDGLPAEHRVFTATWLGFGVNQARESYVETLVGQQQKKPGDDIRDPCMPNGLQTTLDGQLVNGHRRARRAAVPAVPETLLVGTGEFSQCLVGTRPLLAADTTCGEGTQPCLIHDPVPSIDFNVNRFVGVSEYYHSTHGFFGEKGDLTYDFTTYQKRVNTFCGRPWTDIINELTAKEAQKEKNQEHSDRKLQDVQQDAQQACFKASWVINVLHEGIGIPRLGLDPQVFPGLNKSAEDAAGHAATPFRPVDTIDGVEVSWTLGRMLLYASGQVPPHGGAGGSGKTDVLPVGYGSNTRDGSVPADFVYAGSSWEPVSGGGGGGGKQAHDRIDDDWGDTAGDLLNKAREPSWGLGMLVVVLVVVAYLLLRTKERRKRVFSLLGRWSRLGRGDGRRRGRFGSPAKSGNGTRSLASIAKRMFQATTRRNGRGDYERVLEEGQMDEFELGNGGGGSNSDGIGVGGISLDETDLALDGSDGAAGGGVPSLSAASSVSSLRFARASGLATSPQLHVDMFDDATFVGSTEVMDRSGLVVRTESRERLGGSNSLQMLNAGRRSRATSPTRLKSPLMTPLQED